MDAKFYKIRRELDSLGYFQILSLDSVPLVNKLLDDLKITTSSLQKYMKIAEKAIKEKEDFELSLGPRKLDNEKLVKDLNDLHWSYSNYRSQKERDIKELRDKVLLLSEENANLISKNEKLRTSLRETELDLMKAGTVTRKTQQGNRGGNRPQSNYSSPDEDLLRENIEIRHELDELRKELKNLQCKCRQLGSEESSPEEFGEDEIVKRRSTIDYKFSEDKIQRLENEVHTLKREKNDLEKSYKDALSKQHEAMKRAIHLAERNKELEKELKDIDQMAIAVEEECNDAVKSKTQKLTKVEMALKDALQEIQTLERTIAGMKKDKQQLELNNDILRTEKKRMQDMLAEAVKEKSDVAEKLDNMKLIEHDLNMEINRLIQESSEQKRFIAEMESRAVFVQAAMPNRGPGGDGVAIQAAPVTVKSSKGKKAKKGKKKGAKKGKKGKKGAKKKGKKGKKSQTTTTSQVPVNSPTEAEIDKALNEFFPVDPASTQPTPGSTLPSVQSQQPATDNASLAPRSARGSQHALQEVSTSARSCACGHLNKPILSCECAGVKSQAKCCVEKETLTDAFRSGCVESMCLTHFQDLMKREIEQCQCEIKQALMRVTQERDHYVEEYNKLVNQMCQLQSQNARCADGNVCPVCPKTQQVVEFLQHENKMLSQEKMTLVARLEQTRNDNEIIGKCNKSICKRVQRERDLFKADVSRLEEECDCLRDNLKVLCEAKAREHETFTQQINDYERQMKKITSERGELMNAQGTRRAQLDCLEEKNALMKNVLRTTQDDLQNQKILYSQLKNLHDQTDKALHDTQAQLVQAERELAQALQTIDVLKKSSKESRNQLVEMDLDTMKRQLNRIDQEKDDLLNIVDSKTEELANLKTDLKCKCAMIDELRKENAGLKNKLGNITDRAASSDAHLKDFQAEISRLQDQLDSVTKTRDNALEVNRKLQDELATVSREAISLKNKLTNSQEQIDNLKSQSQQYIAEVKKAEDLIQSKEREREELLNQFKQLCLETNHLQSSNNALESQANQSKVQLSVAMDHVHDLEQRSETLETLINDYEKQIGLLTNQIAKFESERNLHMRYQDRTEAELKSLRELCMKLDRDKEQLRMQLAAKEIDGDRINDVRRENDNLSDRLKDCQSKLANAERLLKETRHEGVEMKIKDEEALNEISKLKERIDDLEKRLDKALRDVDMYQEKAFEYNNQIRQLRRQITDERFDKASGGEDDRFPSLYHCTCEVCAEKCIGGVVCDKKCIKGCQTMSSTTNQPKTPGSSFFDSSTPASYAPESRTSQSATPNEDGRNDTLVATAQVVVTDDGKTESLKVNTSQTSVHITSLKVNLNQEDGEVLVEKKTVKGVMTARPGTQDAVCDCRSSGSTSSERSADCQQEMDKLRASLTQALVGGLPRTYCDTGKCVPSCKSYDAANKTCGRKRRSRQHKHPPTSESDEKAARSPCCPSTCQCAVNK